MNYMPINGVRILMVESGILAATFIAAFCVLHFVRPATAPRWLDGLLAKDWRPVLLVVVLALVGRALLLPIVGIPRPRINDEYSYLLMADTFAHHRLANPTPPLWQHFETFHVNFTPTYHSKYPVAQGLALAVGQLAFHQPWIGVYLSTAALCGAICWALISFVPPGWALVGGLLAAVRLALFSYWMNSYWGGSMAALGGALALGAAVRLFGAQENERRRWLMASVFVVGLVILANSRPYEGLAFAIPLLSYFGYKVTVGRRQDRLAPILVPILTIGLAGTVWMGYYNRQTTGNPFLLPYVLYKDTHPDLPLTLPLLFGMRPKMPQLPASDPIFQKWYTTLAEEHGYEQTKTISGLAALEAQRLGVNWLFYVGPALSFPVLLGFLSALTQRRLWIVVAVALTAGIAIALSLVSQLHYFSPATVAIYIFAVEGLRYLWQPSKTGQQAFVIAVCLTVVIASLARQTGSTALNSTFTYPDIRETVSKQLEGQPGKHVVVVSYNLNKHYPGDELVHNGADFSAEKTLWARSKGRDKDRELCSAYGDRTFWSLFTDDQATSLNRIDLCK